MNIEVILFAVVASFAVGAIATHAWWTSYINAENKGYEAGYAQAMKENAIANKTQPGIERIAYPTDWRYGRAGNAD